MRFVVLIPARMASTRLPRKPLADIAGLPMIVRVAQRAMQSIASSVVVAGDDTEIIDACKVHSIDAVLTSAHHASGSDRLAQACTLLGLHDDEIVVNVQGDEPLIDPQLINQVADLLQKSPKTPMSTAAHAIENAADVHNPNVVKVVLDASQHALYFSRSLIPFNRDQHPNAPAPLRHVGIYAYRVGFLKQFPALAQAPIEHSEQLEQLRALWHGHRIAVHVAAHAPGTGVDTPEDLARVRAFFVA